MAELGVGTLNVVIEADGSPAVTEIQNVDQVFQDAAGRWHDASGKFISAGEAAKRMGEDAAGAGEDAGNAGERAAQGAERAGRSLKDVGEQLSKIGEKATKLVTLPIVGALTASVKGASDLTETVSKTEVVFDRLSERVMAWSADSVTAMGLAQGSALEYAATFGDMGKGMGLTLDAATAMSMNLTQLAADLASFKNIRTDVAAQKLTAIYTGETEGLKQLGVVMTQANLQAFALSQGIDKQVSAMSQAELVALRYQYVMSVTQDAQGDFARTGDSLANQTRKLGETIRQTGESFGSQLVPAITPVVAGIQQWVQGIAELDSETKNMILSIALAAAAVGPLLLVGGKLLTFLAAVKAALAALTINPAVLAIGAAVAAIAAIAGISSALSAANRDMDNSEDAYQRMKRAMAGGIDTEITVDRSALDALTGEDMPVIHLTAEGEKVLAVARRIADDLAGDEYAGKLQIDGDPQRAEDVLRQVAADIAAVQERVTIDGDGNAVIGDGGLVDQIQADLDSLKGLVPITEDPAARAALNQRIAALQSALRLIVGNVKIEIPEKDAAALKAYADDLERLPKDETFTARGAFDFDEDARGALSDFEKAMQDAASGVGSLEDAVTQMQSAIDEKLQEAISQVIADTDARMEALGALHNAGRLSDDEYSAEMQRVNAETMRRTDELKRAAEAEKEAAESIGTDRVGYLAEHYDRATEGQSISRETAYAAAQQIHEADPAARAGMQTEGLMALSGFVDAAKAQYQGLSEAVDAYNQAMAEADATQAKTIERAQAQEAGYRTAQDALDRYTDMLYAGNDAQSAYGQVMAEFGDQMKDMPTALAGFDAAVHDSNGALIEDWETAAGASEALNADIEAAAAAYAGAGDAYNEAAQAAREQLTASLEALQNGDYLSTEGARGAMIELTKANVDISEAEAALLAGVPAAVDAALTAAGEAAESGEDPAEALAACVEASAGLVTDATTGAVNSATSAAQGVASSGGRSIGSGMVNGIASAVSSGSGRLAAICRSAVNQAIAAGRAAAQVNSPSRKTRDLIGKPLMEGIGVGFEMETPNVMRRVKAGTEKLMSGAAQVVRLGRYTAPAAMAAAPMDYSAMGDAMAKAVRGVRFGFYLGDRDLAQATREANAQQLAIQSRRVAARYGG